jgi:hypothetical protein
MTKVIASLTSLGYSTHENVEAVTRDEMARLDPLFAKVGPVHAKSRH